MVDPHDEERGLSGQERGEEADAPSEPEPAEGDDAPPGEGRRASKARRVVTFAQVVVAAAQAVDAVIRLFG